MSSARLLVVVTYAGENEYAACMAALAAQTHTPVTVRTIENLPKKQAMDAVYKTFMDAAGTHDCYLHIGADMVLTRPTALAEAIACFEAQGDVGQMLFCVRDFLPDKNVMGVHIIKAGATWPRDDDGLFTDPNPVIAGRKASMWGAPAPFILHAGDPSGYQAFHYGVHRGLKSYQRGRFFAHTRGLRLFMTLEDVYAHFMRTGDVRPGLAMVGAEHARRGLLGESAANRHDDAAKQAFAAWDNAGADAIAAYVSPHWGNKLKRRTDWWLRVGTRAGLPYIARRLHLEGAMR